MSFYIRVHICYELKTIRLALFTDYIGLTWEIGLTN